jgi:predicted Ser/Thr protein kinase
VIGQTLNGRYTVTAMLGRGAMGTVYRALDAQTGREVAVKVLGRDLAFDREMLERFRREGEALRQLRHPNIVGYVDTFQHDGQQVIVMEYISGGNLHDLVKQGPLPIDRARRIALGLCDALTRAHDLNIIHRDLKPENVMLAEDGAPELTDFGVARLMEAGTKLTGTGTQVGTPYYMSPEAWQGQSLDAQSDIWSLGVVLYEMLSGTVPFGGDTVVAVMNKVLTATLPDLNTLRPDAPPALVKIIRKMLTRDKAKRYQTMRQVGVDLEQAAGAAPSASSQTSGLRPSLVPPRSRAKWIWGAAAVGLVGLVLCSGTIVAIAVKVRAPVTPPPTQTAGVVADTSMPPPMTEPMATAPPTAEPAAAPTATVVVKPTVVPATSKFVGCRSWSDNFSSTYGWGDENAGWAKWGHLNGEYRMTINQANSVLMRCDFCSETIDSLRVSVAARVTLGYGTWGIYYFLADERWYAFELSSSGNALLKKYDGYRTQVISEPNTVSLQASNRLTVEAIDGVATAYLNGVQVASAPYSALPSGRNTEVGLITTTQASAPFEVMFDDFEFSACP